MKILSFFAIVSRERAQGKAYLFKGIVLSHNIRKKGSFGVLLLSNTMEREYGYQTERHVSRNYKQM